MSLADRILAVLASADAPLGASTIMAKSGVDRSSLGNTLSRLARAGRIEKQGHGMYFMTDAQRAQGTHTLRAPSRVASRSAVPPTPPSPRFGNGLSAADLSRRLRFLSEISRRPAFVSHALLSEIVQDYRRALDRATGQEDAE